MDRGDGRPGVPLENSTVTHIRLPDELIYVLRKYQISIRSVSLAETVRRLLESHPELTKHAARLYSEGDTSP
jgi:hypothetical protein